MYNSIDPHYPSASIWRRWGALFYDALASFAILMLMSALWLPFYGGHAVPPANMFYQASLVGALYLYFAYSWHKGQTLGMRAWRIRMTDDSGKPVSYRQTLFRFMLAPLNILTLGLSYRWVDSWSHTHIFQVNKS